ncbi:hypothetical protein LTR84_009491 [Exophiala bonariae]|uniref:Protein kinase domain-containing protein n=1 Tax=Exophiala bonariae TaxID=1690606 RepID=A0AAV9MUK9_9EURO|nr:hypothetical protein LTR84_009491 [Exophiala bonariae]
MAPPPKPIIKKPKVATNPKPQEKPSNPDRIDDKWRPPTTITEPGASPETYLIGKKLGKGGFAVCFEGKSKRSSEVLALKVVKAKVEQKKMMEKFRTELQIHAKMHHPNIVEFLRAFTIEDHTYVVLELCPNGSLTEMVKARSCLSLPEVRRYMVQICGGVKYLHKRSVIHRDLKMGNIFIDQRMNLKIGDFGLAAVMADEQDRRTTLCGTPNYIAPEILSKSGSRGHDNKVDTWAVGVICYAMLMGTPPFQSKTQQEIYSKLKTLEYEWKIDSKNYIPQQAKDFVASCLNLNSAERPDMDQLVDHEFFTMGSIADQLDLSCLKMTPAWLENADPRGDRVKPGSGISHSRICRECGVGTGSDGRLRPGVGVGANISALIEIEIENREGCAPSIPLPSGILYKQFTQAHAYWAAHQQQPLLPTRVGKRKDQILLPGRSVSSIVQTKSEVEGLDIASIKAPISGTISTSKPFQSFAAQQRQQALPAPVSRRVEKRPIEELPTRDQVMSEVPPQALLNQRPLRAATIRATRTTVTKETLSTTSKTLPRSTTVPNTIEALAKEIEADVEKVENRRVKKMVSSTQIGLKNNSSMRSVRSIVAVDNATTRPVSSSSSADIMGRILQSTTGNGRKMPNQETKLDLAHTKLSIRHRAASKSGPEVHLSSSEAHGRIIATNDPYELVSKTGNADVLNSLRTLTQALDNRAPSDTLRRPRSAYRSRATQRATTYPRVDKWVDYSTRHGIAYTLSDGSVGMILRSSDDNVRASTCVVVRNGSQHTMRRARGLDYQFVPQGPNAHNIEFYEQTDYEKNMKRLDVPASEFQLDFDTYPDQLAALEAIQGSLVGSEAERMKEIVLLDKFGKYMNKQTPSTTKPEEKPKILVHFYQRVGNVGVWRFVDGGLQFNFPDHTKVSIYQKRDESGDEKYMVDFVYLLSTDASNLANLGMASGEALERRSTMCSPLEDILLDRLGRVDMEIVRTNEVKEKLSWIRAVAGCWIKEGGLGRMGEERLGWSGLQERMGESKIKLQWVTVGRPGGDGEGQLKQMRD